MIPDKIYIAPVGTWDTEHIPDLKDNIYIRKDALMEYVKDRLAQYDPEYTNAGKELQMIIDKINSL